MTLFICLLGKAEIRRDDKPTKIKGHKPLALLAYLLVTGKTHTRQHLVDLLYDAADDPRRSLRWTLNQLREMIGHDYILADGDQVGFNFESEFWLDIDAIAKGQVELYRGEFLEGVYIRDAYRFMDWASYQRERLRQLYQTALTEQLITFEKMQQYEVVVDLGHRLIQLDNLCEEWHRTLMRAYALMGQREAALVQYQICYKALSTELGVEPVEETRALYQQIQAGTLTESKSLANIPVQFPPFLEPASALGRAEAPKFVGRERELKQLDQFLKNVLVGQGQTAFVIGGAGRGKTALLTEFARQAQQVHPDLLMAVGHCDLYAGLGDPYLPFQDIMAMLTGDVAARLTDDTLTYDQARRLWANLLTTCQAILDHGRNLVGVLVSPADLLTRVKAAVPRQKSHLEALQLLAESKTEIKSELAQENLFQQLTNVLQAIAARQPLLLLLDDLQWADVTSISLLFHLGRRLKGSRIMILGAYRPDEVAVGRGSQRHPLEPVLAEFKRMFGDIWVDLGQTEEAEARQFVEAFLDLEPNQLTSAFRQALVRHTGGHPLFTLELVRAMQERGDLVLNEQGEWVENTALNWEYLPAKVEAVFEVRIGRLEEELRQTLTVASIDGEEFTAQVVARVQSINERYLLNQLSQALAKKHRLVRVRGEIQVGNQTLSRYQFAHTLFQRYLYNGLGLEERRLLHAEVGTVLEMLYGEYADKIAAQLAWHFQEARITEKALRYLHQAGHKAASHYANDEAVAYFSRALELAPESAPYDRYTLLLDREKVFDLQGEREKQKQDLIALHQLAEILNDDQKRAEVLIRWSNYAEATSDYLAAITAAQATIYLAQATGNIDSEARGYLHWGQALWRQGNYETAQTQLERGLILAQGIPLLRAQYLRTLGRVSWNQGDYVKARESFEETLSIFRELGDQQGEGLSLNNLGIISALQGDLSSAESYFEQALQICRQIGDRPVEGNILNNLGILAGYRGDYTLAQDYYRQALHLKQEISDRQGQSMVLDNLGDACRYQGDFIQAKIFFEQSLTIRREIGDRQGEGNVLNNLAIVADCLGNYATARRYFEQSLRIRQEIGDRQGQGEGLTYLSLLAHHLGDEPVALEYSQQALQIVQNLGDRHLLGYTWTHLGHALTSLGHLIEAAAAYQNALTIRRELGEYSRAMESLAGLARVHLSQGKLILAQSHVEEILSYLESHHLDGTEEPLRIYLTCYHILDHNHDPRIWHILHTAHKLLQEQVEKISDQELRRSFIENVAVNQEVLGELARKRERASPPMSLYSTRSQI